MMTKLCFSTFFITFLIIGLEVTCQPGPKPKKKPKPTETGTDDQIPDEMYSLCSDENAPTKVSIFGKCGDSKKGEKTVFATFTIQFKAKITTKSIVTLTRTLEGCLSKTQLDNCVKKPTFKTRFDCDFNSDSSSSSNATQMSTGSKPNSKGNPKSSCPLVKGKKYTISFTLRFDQSQIPKPRLSSFWLNKTILKDGNRMIFCTKGNFTVNYENPVSSCK